MSLKNSKIIVIKIGSSLLVDEDTVKDVIDYFSKGKNCEIMTMTTLEKDSIYKIKAKLLSYVS